MGNMAADRGISVICLDLLTSPTCTVAPPTSLVLPRIIIIINRSQSFPEIVFLSSGTVIRIPRVCVCVWCVDDSLIIPVRR